MAITQVSGGDNLDRAQEARRILVRMGLKDRTLEMDPRDGLFVEDMAFRVAEYGDKASISPSAIFFLRDLLEKYA